MVSDGQNKIKPAGKRTGKKKGKAFLTGKYESGG